jgi:hypothetical protein
MKELSLDQFARLSGAAAAIQRGQKPDGQWNCKSFWRISEDGNIVYEGSPWNA